MELPLNSFKSQVISICRGAMVDVDAAAGTDSSLMVVGERAGDKEGNLTKFHWL